MSPTSLARKAFTVTGWTLVSRILGMVRDVTLIATGGGGALLSTFLAAFLVPNLLRNLLGEGALSSAFIPRYAQLRERDPAAAERFAGLVLTRLTAVLSLITVIGLGLCFVVLLPFLPPGPQLDQALLFAQLLAPMLPFAIFICLTAVLGGLLNVRGNFWVAAACPALLNLCLISTIWFGPENDLMLAPYAVLAAGFLIAAVSFWAARATGGIPPLVWRLDTTTRPLWSDFRTALGPSLFAAGIFQVNSLLDSQLALWLLGGPANTILFFANRLLQFPMGLIGHGVTTAAFPELSRKLAIGWTGAAEDIRSAIRLQSFWLLPAAVGLVVCAEPLVRVVYQHGEGKDPSLIARIVLVSQLLGFSLLPLSISRLLVRVFHAARDQTTPMQVSLALVGANLVLNLSLIFTPLHEAGFAVSTTLTGTAGCGVYLLLLHRRGADRLIDWRGLLRPLAAAAVMGFAVTALLHWWPQQEHSLRLACLRLGAAVALGMASYLAIAGTGFLKRRRER